MVSVFKGFRDVEKEHNISVSAYFSHAFIPGPSQLTCSSYMTVCENGLHKSSLTVKPKDLELPLLTGCGKNDHKPLLSFSMIPGFTVSSFHANLFTPEKFSSFVFKK